MSEITETTSFQETCLGLYDLNNTGLFEKGWHIFRLATPVVPGDY